MSISFCDFPKSRKAHTRYNRPRRILQLLAENYSRTVQVSLPPLPGEYGKIAVLRTARFQHCFRVARSGDIRRRQPPWGRNGFDGKEKD